MDPQPAQEREQVNATKDAYVSRELWRPPGLADPAKVEERWAFRNLLGAMYLQMYLLLAAGEKNVVRCENCGQLMHVAVHWDKVVPALTLRLRQSKQRV